MTTTQPPTADPTTDPSPYAKPQSSSSGILDSATVVVSPALGSLANSRSTMNDTNMTPIPSDSDDSNSDKYGKTSASSIASSGVLLDMPVVKDSNLTDDDGW